MDNKELERVYKKVCDFEKSHYETIDQLSDGSVSISDNSNSFFDSDQDNLEIDTTRYPSYKKAFHNRYEKSFKRNLSAVNLSLLKKEIGQENLNKIINADPELKKYYLEIHKELDLDNDGIPDRIDIDDTRNSVQTVSDLNLIKTSTNVNTERYNDKQEQERKKERSDELER